jgi:hypothetical protein
MVEQIQAREKIVVIFTFSCSVHGTKGKWFGKKEAPDKNVFCLI